MWGVHRVPKYDVRRFLCNSFLHIGQNLVGYDLRMAHSLSNFLGNPQQLNQRPCPGHKQRTSNQENLQNFNIRLLDTSSYLGWSGLHLKQQLKQSRFGNILNSFLSPVCFDLPSIGDVYLSLQGIEPDPQQASQARKRIQ